jgi:hypothetical protein
LWAEWFWPSNIKDELGGVRIERPGEQEDEHEREHLAASASGTGSEARVGRVNLKSNTYKDETGEWVMRPERCR